MDPTKISDQGKIDDFENFEYSEILHILMGCRYQEGKYSGNYIYSFGLHGRYSEVMPEFLVSKLGFRGLCRASN